MRRTVTASAALALILACATALAADRVVNVKVRADSEYPGLEAFKAMDGNRGTTWFTWWRRPRPKLPHEIVVDLGGVYEVTGFTYVGKVDKKPGGAIRDYEVYFAEKDIVPRPLAKNVGKPVVKGTFKKPVDDNVVKFPALVKGRYFRLRALSEATGTTECVGVAELILHCEGVKFVGKPWSLRVDFPKAGEDVIALIEGFPLLGRLLELEDPWGWGAMALKEQLLPEGTEPFPDSGDPAAVFVNRRAVLDWRNIAWKEATEKGPADRPGLKVWNHHAYETTYYAVNSASPFIRLHMGRPMLDKVDNMKVLFPKLPQSARKDLRAKMDRIVEALKPYGARKLPAGHRNQPYLLPGGTRMTISDYTMDPSGGRYGRDVRMKIDFEPATPPKGRKMLPLFANWRVAPQKDEGRDGAPGVLAHLRTPGARPAVPATGKEAARRWSDRPTGFASVDALGQNGTTGGAGGKVVTVTTQAELEKYALMKEPYIIRVKGTIKITEKKNPKTRYEKLTTKEVHIASDKTVVGVGKTGEIVNGGFFIGPGMHNVILRNLTIRGTYVEGDWMGQTNDYDGLQMDNAHHVWVDHCHFSSHGDGCLDSRAGTTYLTISWCVFSHHNKTLGVGWDNKVTTQITLHHSWFRNVGMRSPSAGQVLRAHYYNNFLQNISSCSHRVLDGTNMVIQNSFFDNVNGPIAASDRTITIAASGNVYHNSRGPWLTCGRAFFDPGRFYAYPLDKTQDIPKLVAKYAGPQENIGK